MTVSNSTVIFKSKVFFSLSSKKKDHRVISFEPFQIVSGNLTGCRMLTKYLMQICTSKLQNTGNQ